jgi:hypothetical protein
VGCQYGGVRGVCGEVGVVCVCVLGSGAGGERLCVLCCDDGIGGGTCM